MVRSLEVSLRHYVNEKKNDWDTLLGEMQCSINTLEAAGPRSSPFFLNHGREHVARETRKILGVESMMVEDEDERKEVEEEGARVEEVIRRSLPRCQPGHLRELHGRRTGRWSEKDSPNELPLLVPRGNSEAEGVPEEPVHRPEGDLKAKAKGKIKAKMTRAINSMMDVMDCTDIVDPGDMIGRRVRVTWSFKLAKGDYDGEIVDYDPSNGMFSIKYDEPDKNGVDVFDDPLLSLRTPKWIMIKTEKVVEERV